MILKTAENPNSCARRLYFTSAARVAWRHLLKELALPQDSKVLLPSYIGYTEREGSGVFDPIEETGVAYEFYKVDEQLKVDMSHFRAIIEQGNIKVALVIHYFGFCRNNLEEMKQVCKKRDVFLVEDCAHAFQIGIPGQKLGANTDFSFYAVHKYLATQSGGILQVNNTEVNISPIAEEEKADIHVLEQCVKTDIVEVAQIRRKNYALYEHLLAGTPGVEPMYQLQEDDIPHNFPLKVKNGERERLYFYLADKGITTIALYYRLIDEIKKEDFPVSFQVSGEILNLPVHQDTTSEDIIRICSAVKDFYNVA